MLYWLLGLLAVVVVVLWLVFASSVDDLDKGDY